jgi:hypothetical protein
LQLTSRPRGLGGIALLGATLLGADARADEAAYLACCARLGEASCPTTVDALGPRPDGLPHPHGGRVTGAWQLSCDDGAAWYPAAQRTLPVPAPEGLLMGLPPTAARCFAAACALPADLCVHVRDSGARALRCGDGAPAPGVVWSAAAVEPGQVVLSQGRALRAVVRTPLAPGEALPPAAAATSGAAPVGPAGPSAPAYVSYGDALAAGRPTAGGLDLSLPEAPADPCVTTPALRQPAIDQVDQGDEAALQRDAARAAGHYRAALSLDRCNATAWTGLGRAWLDAGAAAQAATALVHAARLQPRYAPAWSLLGRAREALGQPDLAREAWKIALDLKPGDADATAGLRRLGAR